MADPANPTPSSTPEPTNTPTPEPVPAPTEPPKPEPVVEPKAPETPEPEPFTLEKVKLPDGFEVDQELGNEFVSLANEYKLTPEVAQKLVDLQAKAVSKLASQLGSRAFEQTKEQWEREIAADPAWAGEQGKVARGDIARMLKVIGGKDEENIRQAFDLTGAGWNPHIAKFLREAAKVVNESKFVSGSRSSMASERTIDQRLYPE